MRYLNIFAAIIINLCAAQFCAAADIHHLILIWQKPDTPPAQTQALLDGTKALSKIPGIKSLEIHTPISSDRPVVDDSFSYAVLMTFANEQDMLNYQQHPQHVKFIQENVKDKLEKLVIYDF